MRAARADAMHFARRLPLRKFAASEIKSATGENKRELARSFNNTERAARKRAERAIIIWVSGSATSAVSDGRSLPGTEKWIIQIMHTQRARRACLSHLPAINGRIK